MDWQPIETVPKDGTYILAIVAPNDSYQLARHAGRCFVIRHEGLSEPSGYDMGWALYPGYGGVPDYVFSHWMPLPPPPSPDRSAKRQDPQGLGSREPYKLQTGPNP